MFVSLDIVVNKKLSGGFVLTSPQLPALSIWAETRDHLMNRLPEKVKEIYWKDEQKIISGVKIGEIRET